VSTSTITGTGANNPQSSKPGYAADLAALQRLPDNLTELDQWVLWRFVWVKDKWTKVPYQVNGKNASTTDSATWTSYYRVLEVLRSQPAKYTGIGFVFGPDDPYCGIDLDDCFDSDGLAPWAGPIVATLHNCYQEISPSGAGLKIWALATLPGKGIPKDPDALYGLELYDRGRFFTVTGACFNDAPLEIAEYQDYIENLYWRHSKQGKATSTVNGIFGTAPANGKIAEGGRHKTLVSIAGTMRKRGLGAEAINAALQIENTERCQPPYDAAHVRKIAESAERSWQPGNSGNDTAGQAGDWRSELILNKDGTPKTLYANAAVAFRGAPDWQGKLSYDEFSHKMFADNPPWPAELQEQDTESTKQVWVEQLDGRACEWLQRQGIFCALNVAAKAIQNIAYENSFHPVKEYLNSLAPWDGECRVNGWLVKYFGVVPNKREEFEIAAKLPSHYDYIVAVGRCWLISAIARIMQPGCQADYMLVLEGPQGKKKSSALRALTGYEWFTDELAEPGSKDAACQLQGKWIVEMSELDAIRKSDISTVKAFLTRRSDNFRPPYGRLSRDFPRQCVFAGTTNTDDYLKDHTGNRRVWPVPCGEFDVPGLIHDRDQIWAEAFQHYKDGVPWHITDPKINDIAEIEQLARFDSDVWMPHITAFVISRQWDVTMDDVLLSLGIEVPKRTQKEKNRVSAVLKSLGMQSYKKREKDTFLWRYRKP
jgi:hypothetical protein